MSDDVPAWAYERVSVRPFDPRWADRARVERAWLIELLAPWLVDGVEHVGSTAVPGLAAKPIIDLMASVNHLDVVVVDAAQRFTVDGWCFVPPELDGRPWRRFFVKPDETGQHRIAHLHLVTSGHPRWGEQIAFRDALRRDGTLADDYAQLKRRLADRHEEDREAYTNAKAGFIAKALGLAPD